MILSDIDKKDESGDKELIKVFVIVGPKTSGIVTYETERNGKKEHSGSAWDMLEAVKKLPYFKKYRYEINQIMKEGNLSGSFERLSSYLA